MAISEFLGHKSVANFFAGVTNSKLGSRNDIFPKKQFFFEDIKLQAKIACILSYMAYMTEMAQ